MGRWQGLISGGGVMLVLAGVALVAGPAGRASGQSSAAVISVSPASQEMKPSAGQFNIEIKVANVQNLGAFELTLKYNPAVLQYLGAGSYGFLQGTGRSETCLPVESVDATVASFACNTNGLVEGNQGILGPNGSGTLAVMTFQPIAVGKSDLTFVGIDAPYKADGNSTKANLTSLSIVEDCSGGCDSLDLPFLADTGVVVVADEAAPTSTALPATPTPQPRASSTPNRQATVRAALGTPERSLGTTVAGSNGSTTGGGSTGSTSGVAGTAAGPDGVIGTSDDGQPATGGTGGVRVLPSGSTGAEGTGGSSSGGARSASGAPIAGYGPQSTRSPWPNRAGLLMMAVGSMAAFGGITMRRRLPQGR